jgi:hypothetical protein
MKTFAENLSGLPTLDALTTLQLQDASGTTQATIENKPGSQGSFRVYHFVANKWGGLGTEAAREALDLFAEHTEDAKQHPGKHPNIDRLFEIVEKNLRLTVQTS